jgi:hypothetical protein
MGDAAVIATLSGALPAVTYARSDHYGELPVIT